MKNRNEVHEAFDLHAKSCPRKIVRLYKQKFDKKGNLMGYEFKRATCDLCRQTEIMWFCVLCKRHLCFDQDRSKQIPDILKRNKPKKMKVAEKSRKWFLSLKLWVELTYPHVNMQSVNYEEVMYSRNDCVFIILTQCIWKGLLKTRRHNRETNYAKY